MSIADDSSGALRLTASFPEPDSARQAMVGLESLGVDAEAIRLLERPPARVDRSTAAGAHAEADAQASAERSGEQQAGADVAGNYVKGAVISAIVLGVIAALIVLALGLKPRPLAVGLAALGGAIAGFVLGGFLNAARKLPVNVDALDTYTINQASDEPVKVEIKLGQDLADDAEAICRKHGAIAVHRDAR